MPFMNKEITEQSKTEIKHLIEQALANLDSTATNEHDQSRVQETLTEALEILVKPQESKQHVVEKIAELMVFLDTSFLSTGFTQQENDLQNKFVNHLLDPNAKPFDITNINIQKLNENAQMEVVREMPDPKTKDEGSTTPNKEKSPAI